MVPDEKEQRSEIADEASFTVFFPSIQISSSLLVNFGAVEKSFAQLCGSQQVFGQPSLRMRARTNPAFPRRAHR